MIFNLIAALGLIFSIGICLILLKLNNGEKWLKALGVVLFLYKATPMVVSIVEGGFNVPIEFSELSYFILPIIILLNKKKQFHIASFLGLAAGIGFFVFYILLGFTVANQISISDHIISIVAHSYLFIAGLFLFKKYNFSQSNKLSVWVAVLLMVCWAFVFYDSVQRGITFIYYIIKPNFLFIFALTEINILVMITYYVLLVCAFMFAVYMFYKINTKQSIKKMALLTFKNC